MDNTHTSGTVPFNQLPLGLTKGPAPGMPIPYRVYAVVAALRERGLRHSNRNNPAKLQCTNPMALAIIMKISGEMLTSGQVKFAMNLWRTGNVVKKKVDVFNYGGMRVRSKPTYRPGPFSYGYLLQESIEPGYGHCAKEITRRFHEIKYYSWNSNKVLLVERPTYYYKVKRGLVDLTLRGHQDAAEFIETMFKGE